MKSNEEIVQRVLSAVINAEPRVSRDIDALTDKLRDVLPVTLTDCISILTKPAQIGSSRFHIGIEERLVVERAQREYEYRQEHGSDAGLIAFAAEIFTRHRDDMGGFDGLDLQEIAQKHSLLETFDRPEAGCECDPGDACLRATASGRRLLDIHRKRVAVEAAVVGAQG